MTYFLVSDIHSFYTPFIEALEQVGYDKNNSEHTLVLLGDLFDRGNETLALYEFLKSIPKSNLCLIKGNHESLFFSLLKKDFPDTWDFSNGTVKTFCHIAGVNPAELDFKEIAREYYKRGDTPNMRYLNYKLHSLWKDVCSTVASHEITAWLASDEWLNYLEFGNNICVHSFVPLDKFGNIEGWRDANQEAWENARWGCPWKQFKAGLFKSETEKGKTLCVGHWHSEDFHRVFDDRPNDFSLYFSNEVIALDGCTALTNNVEILKITSEGYFNKYGIRLN